MGLVQPVGQGVGMGDGMGLEANGNPAGDGGTVGVQCLRYVGLDQAGGVRGHVVLPAAPDHRVAVTHQEPVAGSQSLPRAVQVGQDRGIAPVHDVKDDAVAAPRRVLRLQDGEVGGAMDSTCGVPGRQLDVGDNLVGRMVGVNGQVDDAVNLAIGSCVAENGAAGKRSDGVDFQSGNCHEPDLQSRI